MKTLAKFCMWALSAVMLSACSPSGEGESPVEPRALVVSDARMTLPPPGRRMGAIYMRLQNHSSKDRQLLSVAADIAGAAAVHRSVYENGVVSMREAPHPVVPAGQTLNFEPGGYHVMLMDMEPLNAGQSHFQMKLTFDGGEELSAQVELVAPK